MRTGLSLTLLTGQLCPIWLCLILQLNPSPGEGEAGGGVPSSNSLSLEDSVRYALEHSPVLGGYAHRRNAARQAVGQARAREGFSFDSVYAHTRQGPVIAFAGREVVRDFRNDLNLILARPLWAPGLIAARRVSQVAASLTTREYEAVRQDVVFETTRAYLEVLRAQSLVEVATKSAAASRERLRVTEAMFRAGNSPRFEVLRAQVDLASADDRLARAQNDLDLSHAAFNTVLGRAADTTVALRAVSREKVPVPDLGQSLERARVSRPELLGAELQIQLNRQRERAARAGDLPMLGFSATYNRQTATSFGRDYRYDAALSVSLPVFDSGLTRHEIRQAREEQFAARDFSRQTHQRIELEVKTSVLNIRNALLRIGVTEAAVAQAEEALRLANLRYQARLAPIVEVLDAEAALTEARNNEVNAWFDHILAHAQWKRAVGEKETTP